MGYWGTDDSGMSFVEGTNMIWGDAPADILADAIDDIQKAFMEDQGRRATKAELRAGMEFALFAYEEDGRHWRELHKAEEGVVQREVVDAGCWVCYAKPGQPCTPFPDHAPRRLAR